MWKCSNEKCGYETKEREIKCPKCKQSMQHVCKKCKKVLENQEDDKCAACRAEKNKTKETFLNLAKKGAKVVVPFVITYILAKMGGYSGDSSSSGDQSN